MPANLKYIPDWNQPQGKVAKTDFTVRINPYDLISIVQKKKGVDAAGKLAMQLLNKKYDKVFEQSKEVD